MVFGLWWWLFSSKVMLESSTPWTAACQASLSITNCQSLLKLMSIESVMPSNHLILCHPLLLPPSIFLSIRGFSNELVLPIRWSKYWSFSFSISPSSEHSGLISFRVDWLDLLAVQGTLKNLLQHHSSKVYYYKWQLCECPEISNGWIKEDTFFSIYYSSAFKNDLHLCWLIGGITFEVLTCGESGDRKVCK